MKNIGKGYLTYAAGAASIVLGVFNLIQGDQDQAQVFFVSGAGLLGLRRAIK